MKKEYGQRNGIRVWKKAIVIGLIGLSTFSTGCSETFGLVTKNGPQYFGKTPTEWYIKHEECHMEKLLEMGEEDYWEKYWNDIQFAVDEETRCGFPDPLNKHPALIYRVKPVPPLPTPVSVVYSYTMSK